MDALYRDSLCVRGTAPGDDRCTGEEVLLTSQGQGTLSYDPKASLALIEGWCPADASDLPLFSRTLCGRIRGKCRSVLEREVRASAASGGLSPADPEYRGALAAARFNPRLAPLPLCYK